MCACVSLFSYFLPFCLSNVTRTHRTRIKHNANPHEQIHPCNSRVTMCSKRTLLTNIIFLSFLSSFLHSLSSTTPFALLIHHQLVTFLITLFITVILTYEKRYFVSTMKTKTKTKNIQNVFQSNDDPRGKLGIHFHSLYFHFTFTFLGYI